MILENSGITNKECFAVLLLIVYTLLLHCLTCFLLFVYALLTFCIFYKPFPFFRIFHTFERILRSLSAYEGGIEPRLGCFWTTLGSFWDDLWHMEATFDPFWTTFGSRGGHFGAAFSV